MLMRSILQGYGCRMVRPDLHPSSGDSELAAPEREIRSPVIMRSRLMLEVASHLVATSDWPDKQVEIRFRPQGEGDWRLNFFASDAPGAVDAVMSGQADIAICNPGGVLAMALKGAPPFEKPMPLRAIMVLPQ